MIPSDPSNSADPADVDAATTTMVSSSTPASSSPQSPPPSGTALTVATFPASSSEIITATSPGRQLGDLSEDDLKGLAEMLGLEPRDFHSRERLGAAIHHRRQIIAAMHDDALVELLAWTGRGAPPAATKEWMAIEIAASRSMRFRGLTQPALAALAALRGLDVRGDESKETLIRRLKKQEGFFAKLNRKRRALLGSIVSNMVGDSLASTSAPANDHGAKAPAAGADPMASSPASPRQATIKQEIEEAGLLGGLAGRIRKSADSYVNQKLDEIEARIDRKLDEIDRRLAEWRDKEIANRIRILKITLWASVVVAAVSLVYCYVQAYWRPAEIQPQNIRQVHIQQ
jgi:hypothetical protein